MKRILLLAAVIGQFGYLTAQENTWDVYFRGEVVQSIDIKNHYVWAATDSFLVRLNKRDKSTTYYSYPYKDENGSSYQLKIDKNGIKWIARSEYNPGGSSGYESYRSSIYSFDGNRWELVKSIGYGKITSLAIDKLNNKWITAVGNNGLYKIEQDSFIQFTPENSGLIYDYVAQVASDKDGNIWVANFEFLPLLWANIALLKNDGDKWITYFSEEVFAIMDMKLDNQGNPWIQSLNIVTKLDTVSKSWSEHIVLDTFPSLQPVPRLQSCEGEDKLWFRISKNIGVANNIDYGIGSYQDLVWSYFTTSNSELPSDTVYQITIDSDGTKWIASRSGLAAFNENGLTTPTNIYSKKIKEIELFPNPTNDFIILKMPGEFQKSRVDILNMQGKVMKSFSLSDEQNRLDVGHFPAGIYLVRIQSGGNQILKKFIKN